MFLNNDSFDDYQSKTFSKTKDPKILNFIKKKHQKNVLQKQQKINEKLLEKLRI